MKSQILTFDCVLPLDDLKKLSDAQLVKYFEQRVLDHGDGGTFGLRYLIFRGDDYLGDNDIVRLFAAFYGWIRPAAAIHHPVRIGREKWTAPKVQARGDRI